MTTETPWNLIRRGDQELAIGKLREAYSHNPSPSRTMELGVAFLWVEDYRSAWEHFDFANRQQPKHSAAFYGMSGVAKWCLNERREAVSQWRAGLGCAYADAAGGVESP